MKQIQNGKQTNKPQKERSPVSAGFAPANLGAADDRLLQTPESERGEGRGSSFLVRMPRARLFSSFH